MDNGFPVRYRVIYSEQIRTQIKNLLSRATMSGMGEEAEQTILTIDKALTHYPLNFGDPWYHLPKAKLRIMVRMVRPWVVSYGVHLEKPVVFIKDLKVYPADAF